jgi:uncharacterized 2Fe-2S/4Fe-4S cluster protein (DUF4445 family)
VRRIEKIETAIEPNFQDLFVAAMAIPDKTPSQISPSGSTCRRRRRRPPRRAAAGAPRARKTRRARN